MNHVGDYDEIHFFGDRTAEGGNDYHLYVDPRVKGHSVKNPEDTIKQLTEIELSKSVVLGSMLRKDEIHPLDYIFHSLKH